MKRLPSTSPLIIVNQSKQLGKASLTSIPTVREIHKIFMWSPLDITALQGKKAIPKHKAFMYHARLQTTVITVLSNAIGLTQAANVDIAKWLLCYVCDWTKCMRTMLVADTNVYNDCCLVVSGLHWFGRTQALLCFSFHAKWSDSENIFQSMLAIHRHWFSSLRENLYSENSSQHIHTRGWWCMLHVCTSKRNFCIL